MKGKLKFTVNKDGQNVELAVVRPSPKDSNKAQQAYNKKFRECVEAGTLFRDNLDRHMREQGLWSDEHEEKVKLLQRAILDSEKKLLVGGIKLNEARKIAIDMKRARDEITKISLKKNELNGVTVESQAEQARYDYLVTCCIVDNETGKRVFNSVDDYLESDQSWVYECAAKFGEFAYGLDPEFEKTLPENKFLSKYKFVDNDLRYVDKKGRYIDEDGRLVNKDGRYINEQGEFIDIHGNRVDEGGLPVVESSPFLDDDGNPVVEDEAPEKPVVPEVSPEVVAPQEVATNLTEETSEKV